MEAAACAGVDSIEHGAYSDLQALQAMCEHDVIWTPTVSPVKNLKGGGRFLDDTTEKITEKHLQMIRNYVKLGGQIALGSDAGAWRVPHADGFKTELAYLKEIVDESPACPSPPSATSGRKRRKIPVWSPILHGKSRSAASAMRILVPIASHRN